MTETTDKSAKHTKPGAGTSDSPAPSFPVTGLAVDRVYTSPGVHPYAEVTWERRDVVITNSRDGSINF
ncbi:MAG: hypothetical protein ACRDU4_03460 [Mycobacterium sp.]